MKITDLTLITGVGPALANRLMEHGISSASELGAATPERLAEIPGIGPISARELIAAAAGVSQTSDSDLAPAPSAEAPTKANQSARGKKEKRKKKGDRKKDRKGSKKDKKKRKGKGRKAGKKDGKRGKRRGGGKSKSRKRN